MAEQANDINLYEYGTDLVPLHIKETTGHTCNAGEVMIESVVNKVFKYFLSQNVLHSCTFELPEPHGITIY